jgi:hypothetical protein
MCIGRRGYRVLGSAHCELRTGAAGLRILIGLTLRFAEEMPSRAESLRQLRDLHVVHQAQAQYGFAL